MPSILELRAERHAISLQMRDVMKSKAPDAAAKWQELDDRQEALRTTIEQAEHKKQVALDRDLAQVLHPGRPNIGNELDYGEGRTLTPNQEARSTQAYAKDFETWLHTGERSAEMRAIGGATGADGATLVPQGFEENLEVRLKSFAGLRQCAQLLKTATGNPLPWPTEDDTANQGEFLAEAGPTGTADPTFGSIMLGSNLVSSKYVKVSVQLEQDAAFNIAGVLLDAFGKRISRVTEPAYLTGNGSGQPNGLLTALVAASVPFVLATGANANSGSAGDTDLNSIGSTDLSNLIDALDPDYRPGAKFMANSASWGRIRRTLDKYGRPIWQTSLSSGVPDSVMGYPWLNNQQMDAVGGGKKSMIFGDFSKYIIRDSAGITLVRYNELFMQNYQRGYQAFIRTDGQLLQPAAFTYLVHPLS
jgi:HK97 family phage major capsid protein